MFVIKRDGTQQEFDIKKIESAITKAFISCKRIIVKRYIDDIISCLNIYDGIDIEEIQDKIENALIRQHYVDVAKSFILYREKHKDLRYIKERADYIDECSISKDNTATLSEVDENANVSNKNVATIEAETYKSLNKEIQRYKMCKKLQEMFPEVADQYVKDLESKIIYAHDEASSPIPKPYCVAVSLYPFLLQGTSSLDGLKTEAPTNLSSFCGQFNNLVFLLSSQYRGAIAFGEFFNVFYYYCVKEWGINFWNRESDLHICGAIKQKTISDTIEQSFQNIIYTINQPAGNRSFQSPFTNICYYDKGYWTSLFENFIFPDGSRLEWDGVNYLQKKFIRWFNKERTKTLLTFPVEAMCLLTKDGECVDHEYEDLTTEMYASGHSFFTYLSNNPDALASCCRLRNEIEKNEFSFTSGLTGVATGSVNVITLNINRIVQDFTCEFLENQTINSLSDYITTIVKRVHKYQIAFKELLYELDDNKMLPVYKAGYIDLKQQFSTIGINGLNEAAAFWRIKCVDSPEYNDFCNNITSTISKVNRDARTDRVKFNLEFVPKRGGDVKSFLIDLEIL